MNRITWRKLSVFVLPGFAVAVAFLGLAACGGGGLSSEPGKRDQTVTPTPPAYQYGSIAVSPGGLAAASGFGDSRSRARDAALKRCFELSKIDCQEVLWFRNACGALAISIDKTKRGVAWSVLEDDAERRANAGCTEEGGRDCHIQTARDGSAFSFCINSGGGNPIGGNPNPIILNPIQPPPPTEYGALATGIISSLYTREDGRLIHLKRSIMPIPFFGKGITAEAAKQDAKDSCNNYNDRNPQYTKMGERRHIKCTIDISPYPDRCGAFAISELRHDRSRIGGYGTGETIEEATNSAIAACFNKGGPMCRVATSEQGGLGILCIGAAR